MPELKRKSNMHELIDTAEEHIAKGNHNEAKGKYHEARVQFMGHGHKLSESERKEVHGRLGDLFRKLANVSVVSNAEATKTKKEVLEVKKEPEKTKKGEKQKDIKAALFGKPEEQRAEVIHKLLEKVESHLGKGEHLNAVGMYQQARKHFSEHQHKLREGDIGQIHKKLTDLYNQLTEKKGTPISKETKKEMVPLDKKDVKGKVIESYDFVAGEVPITVNIYDVPEEYVPVYNVSIRSVSKHTEIILEKIRGELINQVNIGMIDITETKETGIIEKRFKEAIKVLMRKYFPDLDPNTLNFLTSYLVMRALGLGKVEILMNDARLEEIVINSGTQAVWVYQKKHGWLKTNIVLTNEDQARHYASMIARKVGRSITVLEPLLDAHLSGGDRVNATLMPISSHGNTITIRKFSKDQFTITKFLNYKTISTYAAALIWMSMQYELSALIAGGTASGKTSALNVLASFFPPNQRIISIEDTRELQLPSFLHWLPMQTRLPNAEGKGEVAMADLLVNALRQRPDRILVGEVRRSREAETLFEAIHTGHSVYATFHANNVQETLKRLLNPPINVPKTMLPAISLIIMQYRNRRTGARRTFQVAEITPESEANVLLQYDYKQDALNKMAESEALMNTLELYTGFSRQEIEGDLAEKEKVLKYLMKQNIISVNGVGRVMAEFYTNKDNLMNYVDKDKRFERAFEDE